MIKNRTGRKIELWAGPQDGLEVDVYPGQTQVYITDGDAPNPGGTWEMYATSSWKRGTYTFNAETQRFEWVGWEK